MTNTKCTNCGLPIGKMDVLSPTLDPKRRNQCPKCAREWMWRAPQVSNMTNHKFTRDSRTNAFSDLEEFLKTL